MTLGIAALFDEEFYSGSPASALTPLPYPAALNGRGYMLDFSAASGRHIRHTSIEMLRPQQDASNQPAEHSLNPAGLWRRTQNSWHHGAGQVCLDRESDVEEGSDPSRFSTSKGVDPWTKWQLTLLPDTLQKRTSVNTNVRGVTVGTHYYVTDATSLLYTTDLTTFTAVTGTGAAAPTSIATDGYNVWIAQVANGLYTTTRGAAAATQQVTSALSADSVVGYVKGRLMVSKGAAIYNITAAGPAVLPTALFTQNNNDFVWVGFAEGPGNAYAAGFSGDKSLIYRLPLKTDGTGLDVPIVAGELPDGEIVRSIQGYLGFLMIGTDKGVRFCEVDRSSGEVFLGDPITTDSPVYCFEPQDRFVWYGLTNYDTESTGLGRMDLRSVIGTAPAYASDLMVTGQGAVLSVSTFLDKRVFTVSGSGVWTESTYKVASGTLDSGCITFGLIDPKVAVYVALSTLPLVGTVEVDFSQDRGAFNLVGLLSQVAATYDNYPTNQALSDEFEVRLILSADSATDTEGPTVTRYTVKANPAAPTGCLLTVPIRLHEGLVIGGVEEPLVPSIELGLFEEMRLTRRVVLYQEAGQTYTVTVEGIEWIPESLGREQGELNGLCVLTLKTLV